MSIRSEIDARRRPSGLLAVAGLQMVPQYNVALADFVEGISAWRMWGRLGWQEIKRRYRRTVLGPFWNTLSLGIFMVALGFVWSALWHQDPKVYMPFLASGLLAWNLVAAIISEGCVTFVAGEGLIKQLRFPYSILACSVSWRNLIVYFHNLVIFIAVAIYGHVHVTWATLLVLPGLVLIGVNGVWMSMMLGMLVARYRDIQQVVISILQIAMFVTPIFFTVDQLGPRMTRYFANANPLFQYVDIVRSPLLGHSPARFTWAFVLAGTVVGWGLTMWTYGRFRRRLAYWL